MSDPFGEPFVSTIEHLKGLVCSPDELWVDREEWPAGDHGHTVCLHVGWAITEIERLQHLLRSISGTGRLKHPKDTHVEVLMPVEEFTEFSEMRS